MPQFGATGVAEVAGELVELGAGHARGEKPKPDGDQRRTDEVLLRMLKTAPKPHGEMPKKKRAKPRKAAKK